MENINNIIGKITGIHIEDIKSNESFIELVSRFAHMPGTSILMSGRNLDCARYHIAGLMPWLTFSGKARDMCVEIHDKKFCFTADPFDTLRNIIKNFHINFPNLPSPICSGLLGYLSYDLKDQLEKLPKTSVDDLCLPHIWFTAPSVIIIYDKHENITRACVPKGLTFQNHLDILKNFKKILNSDIPEKKSFNGNSQGFTSNFTRPVYIDAVEQIKQYIKQGHVYQVNMSQRFDMDFSGNTFNLFTTLYNMNPAPFFAYINAGNHHIISTSPERFILQQGNLVETRPIKGTRPRGKTSEQDKIFASQLSNSKKDDAELSMIVDLMRNDIGKVCKQGSVYVAEHKRLEPYENVWHLVSIIKGTLDNDKDSIDLIKAAFPGGSITGCPKIRSMEIIDELEPNRRHIYTGSIGYISFHDTMDLSIAIRTATIYNNKIIFSVGGGIVFDSDPADEYNETLHKGKTLLDVFKGKGKDNKQKNSYAWFNGSIKPLNDIAIPANSPGFQYGYGFFETIRVVNNIPQYLAQHMQRFEKTWSYLFPNDVPDLCWDEIIHQVIIKNRLEHQVAAVKIMAAKGNRDYAPFNDSILVSARQYAHRLSEKGISGLHLATYNHTRQTPLADHKTMNYLYYLHAGNQVKAKGADEALILNPDSTVSETNTANIIFIQDKKAVLPVSAHVLPGIMLDAVCKALTDMDYNIISQKVKSDYFYSADQILLTNSLMGAVPVLSLDNKKVKTNFNFCKQLNKNLI